LHFSPTAIGSRSDLFQERASSTSPISTNVSAVSESLKFFLELVQLTHIKGAETDLGRIEWLEPRNV
jgi:hypothetical protein